MGRSGHDADNLQAQPASEHAHPVDPALETDNSAATQLHTLPPYVLSAAQRERAAAAAATAAVARFSLLGPPPQHLHSATHSTLPPNVSATVHAACAKHTATAVCHEVLLHPPSSRAPSSAQPGVPSTAEGSWLNSQMQQEGSDDGRHDDEATRGPEEPPISLASLSLSALEPTGVDPVRTSCSMHMRRAVRTSCGEDEQPSQRTTRPAINLMGTLRRTLSWEREQARKPGS